MKSQVALMALACAVGLGFAAQSAYAASVTFSKSDGAGHSATAVFSVSNGKLKIVLTNTSASDTLSASDLLTGVFWSMNGTPTLLVDKVVLTSGSTAETGNTPYSISGGNVSGEYAFKTSVGSAGAHTGGDFDMWAGAQYGVSSAGLSSTGSGDGLFTSADRFSTANLQGPTSPDGANFGLASAGDKHYTGDSSINSVPIIDNSVTITLKLPTGTTYDLSGIGNLWFQFGTSNCDERMMTGGGVVTGAANPIPLPAASWPGALMLGGLGLIAAGRKMARAR